MATIVNDRDRQIQGIFPVSSDPRFTPPNDRAVLLGTSSNVIKVSSGPVYLPTSVTLTATLLNMTGTVTFTTSPVTTLSVAGNVATLNPANIAGTNVVVTASYTLDGVTHTASQTVTKVSDGAAGGTGTGLFLSSNAQAFTFDGANGYLPLSQVITFIASLEGSIAGNTATWSCVTKTAAGGVVNSFTPTGTGNTRTIAESDFGTTAQYAVVTAQYSTYSDTITIVKLKAGSDSLVGYLTNEAHTVPADNAGVVSSFTGAGGTFRVYLGLVEVTASCSFSTILNSDSLSAPAPTAVTGVYAVTLGSWSTASKVATVTYRASYGGVNIDKVFSISKSLTGTTGGTGNTGNSNFRIYQVNTSGTPPSPPANTTSGATPSGWSATPTAVLTAGQYQYQSDGSMAAGTTTTVWGTPYPSFFKVGQLSAIAADIGTITAGSYATTASTASYRITINDSNDNAIKFYDVSGTLKTVLGGTGNQALFITNTASGISSTTIFGSNTSATTDLVGIPAVYGSASGKCAIGGDSTNGYGGRFASTNSYAVYGRSINSHAIVGQADSGSFFDFYAVGAGGNYGSFTGAHDVLWYNNTNVQIGDIVIAKNCIVKRGYSNTLFRVEASSKANQKSAIGVLIMKAGSLALNCPSALLDDETLYNNIKTNYQRGAANALGEGQINVCGEGGNIESGDLIVTSSIAGKGMKQADDIIRAITVAKAREDVVFDYPTQIKQVACIYVCG